MKAKTLAPFGYEVSDIDLSEELPDETVGKLRDLVHDGGFLLFRDQQLDAARQAAFARRFGPFSGHNQSDREGFADEDGTGFTLRIYTNTNALGSVPELDFHSDNAHNPFSLRYLALYGIDVTTDGKPLAGGETLLASAALAVHRLPADLRDRLEALQCRITAQSLGSFVRPCIERHWATGRPYLVPSKLTEEIVELDREASEALCEQIFAVLYDPAFVYRHEWREGDLLFWDNRLLHHGRGWYDNTQNRTIRRCAIADELEPTAIE
ncbi:MAG: TauD/TfdA family dioxygenase [Novosphingobium sp.]|nr:TauD/TfdA family dioxygenase [Novosphingobium sp.]MCP5401655.1 TauD/TfdA family dioxygenase [Novosphingobium sp.]